MRCSSTSPNDQGGVGDPARIRRPAVRRPGLAGVSGVGAATGGDRWVCRCPPVRRVTHPASIPTPRPARLQARDRRHRSARRMVGQGPFRERRARLRRRSTCSTSTTPTSPTGSPPCPTVKRRGSGGAHRIRQVAPVPAPTGIGRRLGLVPDVDWLGAGGYVIAPPSRHAAGGHYEWFAGPFELDLASRHRGR